ncbi:hypothetical protein [Microvirga alba]|uniref:Uncharacterized protein n=1 Tax=Microvirga alba TaxID=2791025 RepID=A0A931BU05_9HYPH|nr:hypothetical protein [Microvirga alba]MBF9234693.1 hypothetical protein [Microvirga alba]
MPRPKGLPKTGGRQKGKPNIVTADIKALARQYVPSVVTELARLAQEAESEQARVSAIKEILDRAYGKATQPISGDDDAPPVQHSIAVIFKRPDAG